MKSVQELLDESLVRPPHKRSGKWSPSSFGRCFLNQYWNRKDEPKTNPPDKRTLRVFAAGSLFHDLVENLLKKHYDCETEVLVECEDVKGYADIVRENEVIDIKSQHSRAFWHQTKGHVDIIEAKKPNWLQVMYYARELKKDFGRLVFVSKDDLAIEEYVQPLNDYWRRELDYELEQLRSFWGNGLLSPAIARAYGGEENIITRPKKSPYYGYPKECSYCGWFDKCVKEGYRKKFEENSKENPKKEVEK